MTELLPCPFCGGEAELREHSKPKGDYVWCTACYVMTDYQHRIAAIKTWNTRKMTTAFEALAELNRLKRLKDAGLPYSDEEKQQAWANSYEAERVHVKAKNARFMKLREGILYKDKNGNPVHDLVHRTHQRQEITDD